MKTISRPTAAFGVLLFVFVSLGVTTSVAQTAKSSPYEIFFGVDIAAGDDAGMQTYSLPAGKRFVVEHVTAYVSAPSTQKAVQFAVGIRPVAGEAAYSHQMIPVFLGSNPLAPGLPDRYAVSELVKWYSVNDVYVLVERNDTSGTMIIRGTMTGYLTAQ